MKSTKKPKGKKDVKKVSKKLGARVRARLTKAKTKIKKVTPKKLKTHTVANAEPEEKLNEILPSKPAPTPVTEPTLDVDDLDDEAPPPYEDPEVKSDWRGAFAEPAPVGWKSRNTPPGYKVA